MGVSAVRILGPFMGPSGYEHHVREFTRELVRHGIAVHLTHLPLWAGDGLPAHQRERWFEELSEPVEARVALHFCMPHQVVPLSGMVNVNYTMFESTRIPKRWARASRRLPMTIVPETNSRAAWIASGVPAERMRICPLGVRPALFADGVVPLRFSLPDGRATAGCRHRFLNVSAWDPRKNISGLLQAWQRATTPDDDAVLLLKLSGAPPGVKRFIRMWLASSGTGDDPRRPKCAPIHVITETYADREMPRLFAAATHYVSLSHGEGWDLPMMEAVAAGLVPIAPDHSAYRAYLSPEAAHLIPSRLVEVAATDRNSGGAWFAGLEWWQPDVSAAVDVIRGVIDGTLPAPRSIRADILDRFSWERAARRLIDLLAEAETLPVHGRRLFPWR